MKASENPTHQTYGTWHRISRATRRIGFAILFVAVAVAAHPDGIMHRPGAFLWSVLAPLELDVAMTPFTYDMVFVGKHRENPGIHVENVVDKTWALTDFDFYEVRVPILLMAEFEQGHVSVNLHARAICRSLGRHFNRPIRSWKLDDRPKVYHCDEDFAALGGGS